ncbi:MAG: histidine phosphatase family protein [Oligoflexales bacterium]
MHLKTIYIARHGQSFGNQTRMIEGQQQGFLTPKGVRQASALSFWLSQQSPTLLLMSDLTRAIQTAIPTKMICASLNTVITSESLRERHLGHHQGHKKSHQQLDNVEPQYKVLQRFSECLESQIQHHQKSIVFTHSGPIHLFLENLGLENFKVQNGSLTKLHHTQGQWSISQPPTLNYHLWPS